MVPQSVLIQQPAISFGTLVGACAKMFDHNVADSVDSDIRKLSDAEKFLSILEAMCSPGAPVGLPANLLEHVTFSLLTVATMWDMLDMASVCSGMQIVKTETKEREIIAAVFTGTLRQWRDAVAKGCHVTQNKSIRAGFNQIHSVFVGHGLGGIWKEYKQGPSHDKTTFLLIEHER